MRLDIKSIMDEKKINRTQLSRMAEIRYQTVCEIYDGKTKRIYLDTLERICKALECTPADIMISDDNETNYSPDVDFEIIEKNILDGSTTIYRKNISDNTENNSKEDNDSQYKFTPRLRFEREKPDTSPLYYEPVRRYDDDKRQNKKTTSASPNLNMEKHSKLHGYKSQEKYAPNKDEEYKRYSSISVSGLIDSADKILESFSSIVNILNILYEGDERFDDYDATVFNEYRKILQIFEGTRK